MRTCRKDGTPDMHFKKSAIPGIPEESNLAEGPAKLIKPFWWNFDGIQILLKSFQEAPGRNAPGTTQNRIPDTQIECQCLLMLDLGVINKQHTHSQPPPSSTMPTHLATSPHHQCPPPCPPATHRPQQAGHTPTSMPQCHITRKQAPTTTCCDVATRQPANDNVCRHSTTTPTVQHHSHDTGNDAPAAKQAGQHVAMSLIATWQPDDKQRLVVHHHSSLTAGAPAAKQAGQHVAMSMIATWQPDDERRLVVHHHRQQQRQRTTTMLTDNNNPPPSLSLPLPFPPPLSFPSSPFFSLLPFLFPPPLSLPPPLSFPSPPSFSLHPVPPHFHVSPLWKNESSRTGKGHWSSATEKDKESEKQRKREQRKKKNRALIMSGV
ncbi:uncharacterized protein LACBIDRAFT_328269 [Laccaria bicolor S238N-H82]|uniref:Predicted protein n=1 Tax=Laccaria bicolor (strain S238N-H82 / ATCC MYA-4686) TaxID=486041 RepID=B0DED0_LACBS|nr:uncharacterized protein LACBIDRAFT_328269 [Laccaria bicolor S238N-H82]EDR07014.1 predicted protein [Laccaria bicolor S238N-H82]|eukprot:XP_001882387.1 predicted protein [Laccaria bicolor S238N-H82]